MSCDESGNSGFKRVEINAGGRCSSRHRGLADGELGGRGRGTDRESVREKWRRDRQLNHSALTHPRLHRACALPSGSHHQSSVFSADKLRRPCYLRYRLGRRRLRSDGTKRRERRGWMRLGTHDFFHNQSRWISL